MSKRKYNTNPFSFPPSGPITIPLTRGCATVIDQVDADLAPLSWYTSGTGETPYAKRWNPSLKKDEYLHRVVLSRILGRDLNRGELTDHINGSTLDNRRSNLRLASKAENCRNCKRHRHNTSGYKGVSFHSQTGKWRAYIKVNQKTIYLGLFTSKEQAYAAYCEAAQRYFGEFARLE